MGQASSKGFGPGVASDDEGLDETTQLLPTADPEGIGNGNGNGHGNGHGHERGRHDGSGCFHPHGFGEICHPRDPFGDLPVYKTIHRFVNSRLRVSKTAN
jgi:hypothetical protein